MRVTDWLTPTGESQFGHFHVAVWSVSRTAGPTPRTHRQLPRIYLPHREHTLTSVAYIYTCLARPEVHRLCDGEQARGRIHH